MSLPNGFLKMCSCGQLIAKPDPRLAASCSCGLVWDGFRKHQASAVESEHPALNERVGD